MKNLFVSLSSWIITLITPLVIIFTLTRLLLTPVFPEIEYRMPGFPADPYGFTQQERLTWSKLSIEYLLNNQDVTFFDAYKLTDGSPVYNDRELSHMNDVKRLVVAGRATWMGLLSLFLALGLLHYTKDQLDAFKQGLRRGGYLTIGLIGLILLSTFLDFDQLFTQFHKIFFVGDTWLFYYSDTFIRLFPIRFWMDSFIYIGILSLVWAFLFIKIPAKKV